MAEPQNQFLIFVLDEIKDTKMIFCNFKIHTRFQNIVLNIISKAIASDFRRSLYAKKLELKLKFFYVSAMDNARPLARSKSNVLFSNM